MRLDMGQDHTGIFRASGQCHHEMLRQCLDHATDQVKVEFERWYSAISSLYGKQIVSSVVVPTVYLIGGETLASKDFGWIVTMTVVVRQFGPIDD